MYKNIFKCEICKRTFPFRTHLEHHSLEHVGEKYFECKYCSKHFPTGHLLRVHESIHTNNLKNKCTVCKKSFPGQNNVSAVYRRAQHNKPYKCPLCVEVVNLADFSKKQLEYQKMESGSMCAFCSKNFRQYFEMVEHMKNEHGFKRANITIQGSDSYSNTIETNPPAKQYQHNLYDYNELCTIKRLPHVDNANPDKFTDLLNPSLTKEKCPQSNTTELNYHYSHLETIDISQIKEDDLNDIKFSSYFPTSSSPDLENTAFDRNSDSLPSVQSEYLKLVNDPTKNDSVPDSEPPPLIPLEEDQVNPSNDEEKLEIKYEPQQPFFNEENIQSDIDSGCLELKPDIFHKLDKQSNLAKKLNATTLDLRNNNTIIKIDLIKFCNSQVKQFTFRKKVEKAVCSLIGKAGLEEYGYPEKNCEQVLVQLLDSINQTPCADVRINEKDRFKTNLRMLLQNKHKFTPKFASSEK